MARQFTPLHRAFCSHYVLGEDGVKGNATKAYIAAGGSAPGAAQAASRLLARADIQAEIGRLRREHNVYPMLVTANGNGGSSPSHVPEAELLGPDDRRQPRGPMSKGDLLTRQWIVAGLVENAEICMGRVPKPGAKGKKHHDAAGANRAFELLDKQLDKLREDAERQPDGERGQEYLDSALQAKLDEMRSMTPKEKEPA